jgi:hypothetical protein
MTEKTRHHLEQTKGVIAKGTSAVPFAIHKADNVQQLHDSSTTSMMKP